MENFIPQFGLNFNAGSMFQNLGLDSSGQCNFTDWVKTPSPRPCKDVLRQAIRVNRIKKGQVMPVIDKSSTVPKKRRKPIQGEIPEDMLLRRQKNREAAKKCRQKKRKVMETLHEKIDKYEDLNSKLENEIKNFEDEVKELQCRLAQHKCNKMVTTTATPQQHCQQLNPGTSSHHHSVTQHEVPASTAVEDIADSLDDLLSELQDNDRWCEELQQFM